MSYMMKAGKMSTTDAIKLARAQRPIVDPFGRLEKLLLRLETALRIEEAGGDLNAPFNKSGQYGELDIEIGPQKVKFEVEGETLQVDNPGLDTSKNLRLIAYFKPHVATDAMADKAVEVEIIG